MKSKKNLKGAAMSPAEKIRRYLKNIYVYSKRVNLKKNQKTQGGMMAFAWFVFDKTYQGKAMLDWI